MFKPKLRQQNQGFTLVEVLVSILITTLFVTVAMQAIVIAAVFKARAQEFAEATTWIQEDLETVKTNAASLQYTSLAAPAADGATSLTVNSVYGFKDGDVLKVGTAPNSTSHTIVTGGINMTAKTITINPKLATLQPAGQPVVATTRCTGTSTTTGLADHLRDWITDTDPTDGITDLTTDNNFVVTPKESIHTKKPFTFKRTTTITDASPYNLLQVSYDVSTTSVPPRSVAKLNTEVIPDAAFQCP